MTEEYITYTRGAGGVWIAWRTPVKPGALASGRDIAAMDGPVVFAVGPTPDDALASLHAQHPNQGSDT